MRALRMDALRCLHSRRKPTLVAMAGLVPALAACVLVAMLALTLAAPDPAIVEPERVVWLDFKPNPPGHPGVWSGAPVAFAALLKQAQVPLDQISRVIVNGLDVRERGHQQSTLLLIADPDVVPLLGVHALHGDARTALTRRDGIAVTATLARRLWGQMPLSQALGRRIEARGDSDEFLLYTVMAVLPDTDARSPLYVGSSIVGPAMAMIGFESQGNFMTPEAREAVHKANGLMYARLRRGATVQQIGPWMREAFLASPAYARVPVEWRTGREAAYFRGVAVTQLPFQGNERRTQLLSALAAASALLLALAALNFMNLQKANLLRRQRETALRLSLGADEGKLIRLWALETLLPLLFGGGAALVLAWWLMPAMAGVMKLPSALPLVNPLHWQIIVGLALTIAALLLLIVLPPARAALRIAPASALQGRTASEGPRGRRTRQQLLTLQIAGALLLLALSAVVSVQQRHMLNAERGFDLRNRVWFGVIVNPDYMPNMDAFLAALGRHPEIEGWAFASDWPIGSNGNTELYANAANHSETLRVTRVRPSYFATFAMKVLAGNPRLTHGEESVVLDATAARVLGFPSPGAAIGQLVRAGDAFEQGNTVRRIAAVVNDIKMESARDRALPKAFLLTDKPQWDLFIHGQGPGRTQQVVQELWQAHGPPLAYNMRSLEEIHADTYQQEQQLTSLLMIISVLAAMVAMLGTLALVNDTLRRRRMELALHRLHGAGHTAIAGVVTQELMMPLLVAIVLAAPLAAWLGSRYLAGFVDRAGASIGLGFPLLAAVAGTLLFTALASLHHVRRALALHPVEALR